MMGCGVSMRIGGCDGVQGLTEGCAGDALPHVRPKVCSVGLGPFGSSYSSPCEPTLTPCAGQPSSPAWNDCTVHTGSCLQQNGVGVISYPLVWVHPQLQGLRVPLGTQQRFLPPMRAQCVGLVEFLPQTLLVPAWFPPLC